MAKQKSNVVVQDLVSAKRVTATVANSLPVWVTLTAYLVNDIIIESGKLYRCTVAHTAGASFSANAANWGEVSSPTQTVQTLTDGASIAWDSSLGNYAKFTLNTVGATLQNISNPTDGQLYVLTIKNNSQRYLNLGSKYRFNNSTSAGVISVAIGSTTLLITYDALNDRFIIANSAALISAVSYSVSNGGTLNFEDGKTTNYFRTMGGTGVTSTTIGTPTTNFFSGLDGSTKTVYLTLEGSTVDTTYVFSSYWKTETGLSDFGSVTVPAGTLKTYIFWCYIAEAINVNTTVLSGANAITQWTPTTSYKLGEVVEHAPTGVYIKRGTAGTSGATFSNAEAANWELVSSNELKAWTASTYYYEGEIVAIQGKFLKRYTSGISLLVYDGLEILEWEVISYITGDWVANTFYYAGEQYNYNGIIYKRINAGLSQATFNSTEEGYCVRVGTVDSNPKTITAATYTVIATDGVLILDATANAINVTFPSTLPDGKFFTIQYLQTANAITLTAGAGTTIVSPISYTASASFVLPGSVGQYGTSNFFKVGTVFNFVG